MIEFLSPGLTQLRRESEIQAYYYIQGSIMQLEPCVMQNIGLKTGKILQHGEVIGRHLGILLCVGSCRIQLIN